MADKKKPQTAKLPRTIAGVRIGKDLRNAIEPVLRFAGHPLVSELLAVALVAGAERLTEGPKPRKGSASDDSSSEAQERGGKGPKGAKAEKSSPIGLLVAVAAGEIASHIVSAYLAPTKDRRSSVGDRRSGGERRSAKAKVPTKERRSPAQDRRDGSAGRRK
jgi:hypothetical protein